VFATTAVNAAENNGLFYGRFSLIGIQLFSVALPCRTHEFLKKRWVFALKDRKNRKDSISVSMVKVVTTFKYRAIGTLLFNLKSAS
jgi:hypothetical protein